MPPTTTGDDMEGSLDQRLSEAEDEADLRARRRLLESAVRLFPAMARPYLALADTCWRLNDTDHARQLLAEAERLARASQDPTELFFAGAMYFNLAEYHRSEDLLQVLSREVELPDDWGYAGELFFLAGMIGWELGEQERAEYFLRHAFVALPDSSDAAYWWASFLVDEGRWGDASEVIGAVPDSAFEDEERWRAIRVEVASRGRRLAAHPDRTVAQWISPKPSGKGR